MDPDRTTAVRDAARRTGHSLGHRFRRHVRELWTSRGGGFYGFVATLTFLYLEGIDLAGDVAGLGGARIDLGWVISFFVDNTVDLVMNMVRSALWPFAWLGRLGVGLELAALLGGSYVAYRLLRPSVLRLLEEPEEWEELAEPGPAGKPR